VWSLAAAWLFVTGVSAWGVEPLGTGFTYQGQLKQNGSASPSGRGVLDLSAGMSGRGVYGWTFAGSGTNYGVYGRSDSTSGFDFYASGAGTNYGAASSIRWKSNIAPIDAPLDKLARLRGVYFDWDAEHGGHHDVGMIAEEVGKVLPEIVNYEENGIDAIGMDYSKMTPLLVEAVKALHAEVDRLQIGHEAQLRELRTERDARLAEKERRISVLEKQNEVLTARLERLEKLLTVNPQHKEMTK
jgi:hypothetical protein